MTHSEKRTIVAFGDSITEGTYGGADVSQTWPVLLQQLLNDSGFQVEVLNAGIPGETAPEGLQRFTRQVVHLSPEKVIIMYGANDSFIPDGYLNPVVSIEKFNENMEKMVLLAIQNSIVPILMTTTPFSRFIDPDDDDRQNRLLDSYLIRVRAIAKQHNLPLVDHFKVWMELDKKSSILNKYLPDGVHPNVEGNSLIAQTSYDILRETFQNE